jgi:hypothetical protein
MRFEVGFAQGSSLVHLTHTTLSLDALCGHGEPIEFHGEPDLAVICEDCDRIGRELAADPGGWMRITTTQLPTLRAAA